MRFILLLLLTLAFAKKTAQAQKASKPEIPLGVDTTIKAIYEVISGPPGPRNWDRFRNMFMPEARMWMILKDKDGKQVFKSVGVEEYITSNGTRFEKNGFWEQEVSRQPRVNGKLASIFSEYQIRLEEGGPIKIKGLNLFQLMETPQGWKFNSITWEVR